MATDPLADAEPGPECPWYRRSEPRSRLRIRPLHESFPWCLYFERSCLSVQPCRATIAAASA